MGRLTEYERFVLAGGDELIWALRPSGKTLVLGGFEGLSTSRYASTSSKVISLEPVETFRAKMLQRIGKLPNVQVLNYAATSSNGSITLSLSGDGTSEIREIGEQQIEVEARDIAEVVQDYGPFELMECNIEGGEYSVINRLSESGELRQIEKVLVQFHDVGSESERLVAAAHESLSITHEKVWFYDWVWELWVRRKS